VIYKLIYIFYELQFSVRKLKQRRIRSIGTLILRTSALTATNHNKLIVTNICILPRILCQSQRPRGLRCRSTAACLLRPWVRNPPGAWMFFCCVYCVLSGRGLCDELITRPEESYRLWLVDVCSRNLVVRGSHSPSWAAEPEKQTNNRQTNRVFCIS
jgi:hypothetical protein